MEELLIDFILVLTHTFPFGYTLVMLAYLMFELGFQDFSFFVSFLFSSLLLLLELVLDFVDFLLLFLEFSLMLLSSS